MHTWYRRLDVLVQLTSTGVAFHVLLPPSRHYSAYYTIIIPSYHHYRRDIHTILLGWESNPRIIKNLVACHYNWAISELMCTRTIPYRLSFSRSQEALEVLPPQRILYRCEYDLYLSMQQRRLSDDRGETVMSRLSPVEAPHLWHFTITSINSINSLRPLQRVSDLMEMVL